MHGRKVVIKTKWPQGPAIGTVLEERKAGKYYADGMMGYCMEDELQGYVEDLNKQKEVWFMNKQGKVELCNLDDYCYSNFCPPAHFLRFRTKESAEKFTEALKETWKQRYMSCADKIEEALNDRVN